MTTEMPATELNIVVDGGAGMVVMVVMMVVMVGMVGMVGMAVMVVVFEFTFAFTMLHADSALHTC